MPLPTLEELKTQPRHIIQQKIAEDIYDLLITDFEDTKIVTGVPVYIPDQFSPLVQVLIAREGNVRQETGHQIRQYLGHINIYYYVTEDIDFTDGISNSLSDLYLGYIHDLIITHYQSPPYDALENLSLGVGRGKVQRINFKDIMELGLVERETNYWNMARIPFGVETRELR